MPTLLLGRRCYCKGAEPIHDETAVSRTCLEQVLWSPGTCPYFELRMNPLSHWGPRFRSLQRRIGPLLKAHTKSFKLPENYLKASRITNRIWRYARGIGCYMAMLGTSYHDLGSY